MTQNSWDLISLQLVADRAAGYDTGRPQTEGGWGAVGGSLLTDCKEALRDSGRDSDKLDANRREGDLGSAQGGSNKKNKQRFSSLFPFPLLETCECQVSKLPRKPSFEPRICPR